MKVDPDSLTATGLRGYVYAVARAVGVGAESAIYDLGQVATAYIALEQRMETFPDRDLALLWDEEDGWAVAVEVYPSEESVTLAYLGRDVIPAPDVVGGFVETVIAGRCPGRPDSPGLRWAEDDDDLELRLERYAYPGPSAA